MREDSGTWPGLKLGVGVGEPDGVGDDVGPLGVVGAGVGDGVPVPAPVTVTAAVTLALRRRAHPLATANRVALESER